MFIGAYPEMTHSAFRKSLSPASQHIFEMRSSNASRTWLTLMLLGLGLFTSAQTRSVRQWQDGPLTWADFREQSASARIQSEIAYYFRAVPEQLHIHDTIIYCLRSVLELNRSGTWIDPASRNQLSLAYHQVVFDLAEVCRRALQRELDLNGGADLSTNWVYRQSEDRIQRFMAQSRYGLDTDLIAQYAASAQRELAATAERERKIPPFRKTAFGLGLFVGLKSAALNGDLQRGFTTPIGLDFGFDFGYKEWRLVADALLGGTSSKVALPVDPRWTADTGLSFAHGSLTIGHPLLRNSVWSITPYAGPAFTEISLRTKDQEDKDPKLSDGGWLGGLQLDVRCRQALRLLYGTTSGRSFNTTMLRLNVSAMPTDLGAGLKGTPVYVGLGICWYSNFLRSLPQ
jgi:hypothetical protein